MTLDHASTIRSDAACIDDTPLRRPPAHWVERGERATTILLVGRLVNHRGDHICRIRNVSRGGMMVECAVDLTVGAQVRIETGHVDPIAAEIVWAADSRFGLRALAPITVDVLLDAQRRRGPLAPRAPRLTAAAGVQVWARGRPHPAILRDLSQAGCRIAVAAMDETDRALRIVIPGLPPRMARLCWTRDGHAGLSFVEPYSFATLCAWQTDYAKRFALAG